MTTKLRGPAARPGRWRILVADDDESTRFLYSTLLARAGYDVDAASDGNEAWVAMQENPYDLLLTDHRMPHLTGLQLVGRMRAAGIPFPVIVNSGSLDDDPYHPDLNLAAVLHKPFDFEDILEAVTRILPVSAVPNAGTVRRVPSASNVVPLSMIEMVTPQWPPADTAR